MADLVDVINNIARQREGTYYNLLNDMNGGGYGLYGSQEEEPYFTVEELYRLAEEDSAKADEYAGMVEGVADQVGGLATANLGLYTDSYQPILEQIAEDAGVGGSELNSRLGLAVGDYEKSVNNSEAAFKREMQRLGVNPNSGRYLDNSNSRALDKALGLAQVKSATRQQAREDDWSQKMQAGQLGFNISNQATHQLGQASNMYGGLMNTYGDAAANEMSLARTMKDNETAYGLMRDQQQAANVATAYGLSKRGKSAFA
jgi:hypothetical protein